MKNRIAIEGEPLVTSCFTSVRYALRARGMDDISCHPKKGEEWAACENRILGRSISGDNSPEFSTPVGHSMQRIAICPSQSDGTTFVPMENANESDE